MSKDIMDKDFKSCWMWASVCVDAADSLTLVDAVMYQVVSVRNVMEILVT